MIALIILIQLLYARMIIALSCLCVCAQLYLVDTATNLPAESSESFKMRLIAMLMFVVNVFLLCVSRSIGMMACIAAYVLFFVTFKPNEHLV
jgi:hypothetical protein